MRCGGYYGENVTMKPNNTIIRQYAQENQFQVCKAEEVRENEINPKVGEVWLVNIPNAIGHQQKGTRPFVVTSNNKRNKFSPTVKGVTLSKRIHKQSPVHVLLKRSVCPFLTYDSIVNCEEVNTLNKTQFIKKLGKLTDSQMLDIAIARVQDEPFLFEAFLSNVQNTRNFIEFRQYA